MRIQKGEPIAQKATNIVLPLDEPTTELVEVNPEEIDEALRVPMISEHVRMQWTLARLGLKAGERVWVPVGDQAKLRQAFHFESFDSEFSAGIDLPHSYIENIDVVWKQEFRIGAAYEIENSTSIYSGLLRFADLNIIAPNTLYPMFIVAPREKKGRVSLREPGGAWAAPTLVTELSIAGFQSLRPNVSQDGREIVFDSDRPGGEGAFDIWYAHRATPWGSWSAPVNAGPAVNSASSETRASLSRNGRRLYFGSNRAGFMGNSDLFESER